MMVLLNIILFMCIQVFIKSGALIYSA